MNNKLSTITNLFDGKEIRSIWDVEKEDYYFSVVDVIAALTDATIPRNYWSDLKRKLIDEGSEVHKKIVQLKLIIEDEYIHKCNICGEMIEKFPIVRKYLLVKEMIL